MVQVSITDDAERHPNPIEVILEHARRVGLEYCWPLPLGPAIIRALGELDQAVLGYEIWSFGEKPTPRVHGVSEYRVDLTLPWSDIVATSAVEAATGLARHLDQDMWIQVTWISRWDSADYLQTT